MIADPPVYDIQSSSATRLKGCSNIGTVFTLVVKSPVFMRRYLTKLSAENSLDDLTIFIIHKFYKLIEMIPLPAVSLVNPIVKTYERSPCVMSLRCTILCLVLLKHFATEESMATSIDSSRTCYSASSSISAGIAKSLSSFGLNFSNSGGGLCTKKKIHK